MQISLSKESDVPLQQQLAEQIVFLITTGHLHTAQQLPSVRALARRLAIHHNTVSKAYQDLVRRGWLRRRQGSRLYVGGEAPSRPMDAQNNLDDLISQSMVRAREMGYSLQALREKILDRLFAAPPDHILIVEEEPGLRHIIRAEICSRLGKRVHTCSPEQFAGTPELSVGALVIAPDYAIPLLNPFMPPGRTCVSLTFSGADEHLAVIRNLKESSMIGVVSASEMLLKTARSLLASALGQRHALQEFRIPQEGYLDLHGVDVAFCDSLAMPVVRCPRKIHYRLIAPECLQDVVATLESPAPQTSKLTGRSCQRKKPNRSHSPASGRARRGSTSRKSDRE